MVVMNFHPSVTAQPTIGVMTANIFRNNTDFLKCISNLDVKHISNFTIQSIIISIWRKPPSIVFVCNLDWFNSIFDCFLN